MAIMAAGVHATLVGRLVNAVAQFLNRQGIHVGTQADGRTVTITQGANHTSAAQPTVDLDAETAQQLSHLVGGFQLLKPQFRRGMEGAAPHGCFVNQRL